MSIQIPAELMEAFPVGPALRKNCLLRPTLMSGGDRAERMMGKDVQELRGNPEDEGQV